MNIRIAMRYLRQSKGKGSCEVMSYMKVVSNWKVILVGQTW